MKKVLLSFLSLVLVVSSFVTFSSAANLPLKVQVDGKTLVEAPECFIDSGITYAPVRSLAEGLGGIVGYTEMSGNSFIISILMPNGVWINIQNVPGGNYYFKADYRLCDDIPEQNALKNIFHDIYNHNLVGDGPNSGYTQNSIYVTSSCDLIHMQDKNYCPVRLFALLAGFNVDWNNDTQTVTLTEHMSGGSKTYSALVSNRNSASYLESKLYFYLTDIAANGNPTNWESFFQSINQEY